MTNINEIASVHLGKAGNGTVVEPYKTPDRFDPSLLVPIPRVLNRTEYDITEKTKMVGVDVWNAYEVSFLTENSLPVNAVGKIVYDANSEFIVESKSLKLYLNSFNMHRIPGTTSEALMFVERQISKDLSKALETDVSVSLFDVSKNHNTAFTSVEFEAANLLDVILINLDEDARFWVEDVGNNITLATAEDPNILKTRHLDTGKFLAISSALRSNCRVTNQPDWGDIIIYMNGPSIPNSVSLYEYIMSMRSENHFHEEICECVYKRLLDIFNPDELMVICLYTRRGGIDINPIRASSKKLLSLASHETNSLYLSRKTVRQ